VRGGAERGIRLAGRNTLRKADREVRPTFGEGFEFLEGEAKAALGGIHAALEAGELVPAGTVPGLVFRAVTPPEGGFGFMQAAELPFAVRERINQGAMLGERRLPALVVLFDDVCEFNGIFAGNDPGFGVNAGFKGIEAGDGLALKGTRAGGFLRAEEVGLFLLERGHSYFQAESSRRACGGRVADGVSGLIAVRWEN
jgi:hypothetical protein